MLIHFAMFSSQDDDVSANVAKIMTIHTAKGLEFNTVFVPGLVEGQFPSHKLKNRDEFEEERRLFYVAVTRAKEKLYLSSHREKAEAFYTYPSSFLSDIDQELLNKVGRNMTCKKYGSPEPVSKTMLSVGDQIEHPVFGAGIIVDVFEREQCYEIHFMNYPQSNKRIQFRAVLAKTS